MNAKTIAASIMLLMGITAAETLTRGEAAAMSARDLSYSCAAQSLRSPAMISQGQNQAEEADGKVYGFRQHKLPDLSEASPGPVEGWMSMVPEEAMEGDTVMCVDNGCIAVEKPFEHHHLNSPLTPMEAFEIR